MVAYRGTSVQTSSKNVGDETINAKSELQRSAVANNLSGKSKLSDVRTSSGMFIKKGMRSTRPS
ncbi:hypothetical protein KSP40_PGU001448 [Platanthera guangdongensis]|uniref:Uncharacterized protein n=1 Tax=Platanthera guangdongensis TaxID=2320717 RepID=A0ABR2M8Z4_9ASPA